MVSEGGVCPQQFVGSGSAGRVAPMRLATGGQGTPRALKLPSVHGGSLSVFKVETIVQGKIRIADKLGAPSLAYGADCQGPSRAYDSKKRMRSFWK